MIYTSFNGSTAKPGNKSQEAEEMDRILEFMERKFGNEQKQAGKITRFSYCKVIKIS